MHLHNRQIKATFWNDPDLLMWARDKRWFYEGLIQLADDSGCLEDSLFAFKLNLFPSPIDSDITVELLASWLGEMVESRQVIRYSAERKSCLYLANFRKHQSIKNAEKPDVPLPPWVLFETFKSNERTGKYVVNDDVLTEFLRSSYDVLPIEVNRSEVKRSEDDKTVVGAYESQGARGGTSPSDSSSLSNDFAEVAKAYQAEIGPGSEIVRQELQYLIADYTAPWVLDAIREAVLHSGRSLAYVKGILSRWKVEGRGGRKKSATPRASPPQITGRYIPDGVPDYVQAEIDRREAEASAKRDTG